MIAHAGDSRAVLCTAEGADSKVQTRLLTEDHSPGIAEEQERILAAGGTVKQDEGTIPLAKGKSIWQT